MPFFILGHCTRCLVLPGQSTLASFTVCIEWYRGSSIFLFSSEGSAEMVKVINLAHLPIVKCTPIIL